MEMNTFKTKDGKLYSDILTKGQLCELRAKSNGEGCFSAFSEELQKMVIIDINEVDFNPASFGTIQWDTKTQLTTYYYCVTDSSGQRTGNYRQIELPASEVVYKNGFPYFGNKFLYTDFTQCLRACQN